MASPSASAPAKTLTATGPVIIVILIIVAAILGFYQVVYYPSVAKTQTTPTTTTVQPSEHTVEVIIANGASLPNAAITYVPDNITVYIGYNATVEWMNNDSTVHTVTANANSPDPRFNQFGPISQPWNNIWQNGSSQGPSTANFTFTIPGTYSYYCSYHNWMKGEVIVKSAPPGLITSASSATTVVSSSAAAIQPLDLFVNALTDLARSFATLTGSAAAP
ncbi:MAG: cupredoxin domain-containing protein [Nitrososphaerota archaeon]|nr:cupredoxin domain-containing protein [Nitrososphaerota archaeon]